MHHHSCVSGAPSTTTATIWSAGLRAAPAANLSRHGMDRTAIPLRGVLFLRHEFAIRDCKTLDLQSFLKFWQNEPNRSDFCKPSGNLVPMIAGNEATFSSFWL